MVIPASCARWATIRLASDSTDHFPAFDRFVALVYAALKQCQANISHQAEAQDESKQYFWPDTHRGAFTGRKITSYACEKPVQR